MPVQIIINGVDANESIAELSVLAAAINGQAVVAQPVSAPVATPAQQQKAEKPERQRNTAKPEPDQKQEPASTEPPKDTSGVEPETPGKQPEAEVPALARLLEVATSKGQTAEGKAKIKALLEKYESRSVSKVPEEQRAAFLAELEEL